MSLALALQRKLAQIFVFNAEHKAAEAQRLRDCLFRQRQELIESLQHPAPDTEPLQFSSKFARTIPEQFLIILRKFFTLYNRMPEYNAGQHRKLCAICPSKTCNHYLATRVCLPDSGLWS